MYAVYAHYVAKLKDTANYRLLPEAKKRALSTQGNFSCNDYLGLSRDPDIILAAKMAAECDGVGATGSRLLSGNYAAIEALEQKIARDKHTEAALIFNSGFQANSTVLACLLDKKILAAPPLVFFDKFNHASLYQAVFLSGAQLIRYRHNDVNHLSELLKKYAPISQPKFIVTETVFGMDGDVAPLADIVTLATQHQTFLYLDEAHATGILGPRGYGLSTMVDLTSVPHLIMGTFSKALGSSGGYIACSDTLKNYLINKAPGFIYSTAPSPMVIGANNAAWEKLPHLTSTRNALKQLSQFLRENLIKQGWDIGLSTSHIIPLLVKKETIALQLQQQLAQKNLLVSCIRPPTVPPGSARLRIALTALHQRYHVEQLLEALST